MAVDNVDDDNGVVEGAIASHLLKSLEQVPGVKFVRDVFNYMTDFPLGEARNADDEQCGDEHIPR
jgi:hypothetical protein